MLQQPPPHIYLPGFLEIVLKMGRELAVGFISAPFLQTENKTLTRTIESSAIFYPAGIQNC